MLLGREMIRNLMAVGTLRAYRYADGEEKRLVVEDLHIGTNSIDVSLSNQFLRPKLGFSSGGYVDAYEPTSLAHDPYVTETLVLHPGETTLGCTRERFEIGAVPFGDTYCQVAPMYDGRSTCGRLFLASHITAGYGDVGFASAWTLELKNMSEFPLVLHAGMRIGQVSFALVLGDTGRYQGAYTEQHRGPKAPQLGKERFT